MRWPAALLLLATGCPHGPARTPPDAGTWRCPSGTTRTPERDVCLTLPADYQLVRKEREPAFDRWVFGFDRPGDRPTEIRLDVQWFPAGRDRLAVERDYAAELTTLTPDGGDLEFDSSTDDVSGHFLRVRLRPDGGGEVNQARSLVRTPHYRVRCSVDLAGLPDIPVLDACRTLSAAP